MFTEKEFISEDTVLSGRWYCAQDTSDAPCIIMCHGTSATIKMCLTDYASEFQKRALTYFFLIMLDLGEVTEKKVK